MSWFFRRILQDCPDFLLDFLIFLWDGFSQEFVGIFRDFLEFSRIPKISKDFPGFPKKIRDFLGHPLGYRPVFLSGFPRIFQDFPGFWISYDFPGFHLIFKDFQGILGVI